MKKKGTTEADVESVCRADFSFKDHDGEEWIE
jgi:hypothetical protein